MEDMDKVVAQYQGTIEGIQNRLAKTVGILYAKEIDFRIETVTKMMRFRVLVSEENLTPAKDALFGIFEEEARKLQMQTDSEVVLKLAHNVIKPGQTVLIGRAPAAYKLANTQPLPIEGDFKMGNSHIALEWDGFGVIRIKDMGEGNGVLVGGVPITPGEWLEIEPGASVRIGQTTLRFVML